MIRTERPLDLLEAAYRLDGSDADWLGNLLDTTGKVLPDQRYGMFAFFVSGRVDSVGRTVISDFPIVRGSDGAPDTAGLRTVFLRQLEMPAELQSLLYFSPVLAETVSVVTELLPELNVSRNWTASGWETPIVRDAFGLVCHDGPLNSVVLSVQLREPTRLSVAERRLWQWISSHVGAAARLRRGRGARPGQADAIMSPSGEVHHLAADADLDTVKEGFTRRHSARQGGEDTETALQIWQGLHDGRWSLVDYVDTDGKAFVLAVRNEPARDVPSTLTDRQRAVAALAALGYGNKQIGYALGLTAAAVAMLLARARDAIGCRNRSELVRAFKRDLRPSELVQ